LVHGQGEEAGAPLIRHPDVALVSFVGSPEVGREVAIACAAEQKQVSLELGEQLAILILDDLFLDENWERRTIPDLIPDARCKEEVPASECWARFRAKHSLAEVQARWRRFWKANEERVLWDEGARCFRVNGAQ